jgi:hypothetical protein
VQKDVVPSENVVCVVGLQELTVREQKVEIGAGVIG